MAITPTQLADACADLCTRFGLEQAYFARVLGPRRHYLAGHGRPGPARPSQRQVTDDIAFFWHGRVDPDREPELIQAARTVAGNIHPTD